MKNNKVDVNRKRRCGRTALEVASRKGHLKIVRELLKSNELDVNVRKEYEDKTLTLVSRFNRINIVRELINHNNIDVNHHLRGEILIITIYLYFYYNGLRIQITVHTYFF